LDANPEASGRKECAKNAKFEFGEKLSFFFRNYKDRGMK